MRPTSMRMVVVLPAPFGPEEAEDFAGVERRSETSSTMVRSPMTLVRCDRFECAGAVDSDIGDAMVTSPARCAGFSSGTSRLGFR